MLHCFSFALTDLLFSSDSKKLNLLVFNLLGGTSYYFEKLDNAFPLYKFTSTHISYELINKRTGLLISESELFDSNLEDFLNTDNHKLMLSLDVYDCSYDPKNYLKNHGDHVVTLSKVQNQYILNDSNYQNIKLNREQISILLKSNKCLAYTINKTNSFPDTIKFSVLSENRTFGDSSILKKFFSTIVRDIDDVQNSLLPYYFLNISKMLKHPSGPINSLNILYVTIEQFFHGEETQMQEILYKLRYLWEKLSVFSLRVSFGKKFDKEKFKILLERILVLEIELDLLFQQSNLK